MSRVMIDGSSGEGGGQIVRTVVALSALTMKPVRIINIRAGRSKPGLRRQHIVGIELTGQLVNADITGLKVGNMQVDFTPQERRSGHFRYDIGTAGAMSLVLQAVLPAAVLSPGPIELKITGGTDVPWSPPIDYMQQVFGPMVRNTGPRIDIVVKQRGHYPKGGGQIACKVTPVDQITALNTTEFGELSRIEGISHCVRLPPHVAARQASAAKKLLHRQGIENVSITEETYPKGKDPHLGPGSGIVLWAESEEGVRIGADSLGERGKRAERVGEEAASQLVRELSTGCALDSHLCDILVPYLAVASGKSTVSVTRVTSHLRTNIEVLKQVLGVDISLREETDGSGVLEIRGLGLSLRE